MTFKVGDKVRVAVGHLATPYYYGAEGEVRGVIEGARWPYEVKFPGIPDAQFCESEIELIEEKPAMELKFKVGDKVFLKETYYGIGAGRVGTVTQVDAPDEYMPYLVDFGTYGAGSVWVKESALGDSSAGQKVATSAEQVNHPAHYTWLPNGLEVIDITKNFSFVRGNALKYLMRADHKGKKLEDLKKALWYVQHEIDELEKAEGEK